MKFDAILEYQKIDANLVVIEDAIKKSHEGSVAFSAKQKLDEATEMVKRLQAEASDVMAQYDRMSQKASELVAQINELYGIVGEAGDINEVEHYTKLLTALTDELAKLESDVAKDISKSQSIDQNYKKTWDDGIKATNDYKIALSEFNKLRNEKSIEANPLIAQLKALEPQIDSRLLDEYKILRGNKKLPAFVEYDASDPDHCSRCRMELPADAKGKLKKPGDFAECPNCRRFLYIPD